MSAAHRPRGPRSRRTDRVLGGSTAALGIMIGLLVGLMLWGTALGVIAGAMGGTVVGILVEFMERRRPGNP